VEKEESGNFFSIDDLEQKTNNSISSRSILSLTRPLCAPLSRPLSASRGSRASTASPWQERMDAMSSQRRRFRHRMPPPSLLLRCRRTRTHRRCPRSTLLLLSSSSRPPPRRFRPSRTRPFLFPRPKRRPSMSEETATATTPQQERNPRRRRSARAPRSPASR